MKKQTFIKIQGEPQKIILVITIGLMDAVKNNIQFSTPLLFENQS